MTDLSEWVNVQTKLPTELKTRLKAEAALSGVTQAELIARALTAYLDTHSKIPTAAATAKEK